MPNMSQFLLYLLLWLLRTVFMMRIASWALAGDSPVQDWPGVFPMIPGRSFLYWVICHCMVMMWCAHSALRMRVSFEIGRHGLLLRPIPMEKSYDDEAEAHRCLWQLPGLTGPHPHISRGSAQALSIHLLFTSHTQEKGHFCPLTDFQIFIFLRNSPL